MGKNLKLFKCLRDDLGWSGAVLIYTYDKDDAIKRFIKFEEEIPYKIEEIDLSEPGIVYNDECR